MTEKDLALQSELLEKYPYVSVRPGSADHASFDVPADKALEFAFALRDKEGFAAISDCEGCDWGVDASPRFSAIWHVYSYERHLYVRMNVYAPDNAKPAVPSLCAVWAGCNWHEREAFDLVGIDFTGHPDMRRILMWDEYPYHPLRKDFPLSGRDAPLPDTFADNEDATKVVPAPEEGGPFHSPSTATIFASQREPRSADTAASAPENP